MMLVTEVINMKETIIKEIKEHEEEFISKCNNK